jgi:hypothetical protein
MAVTSSPAIGRVSWAGEDVAAAAAGVARATAPDPGVATVRTVADAGVAMARTATRLAATAASRIFRAVSMVRPLSIGVETAPPTCPKFAAASGST